MALSRQVTGYSVSQSKNRSRGQTANFQKVIRTQPIFCIKRVLRHSVTSMQFICFLLSNVLKNDIKSSLHTSLPEQQSLDSRTEQPWMHGTSRSAADISQNNVNSWLQCWLITPAVLIHPVSGAWRGWYSWLWYAFVLCLHISGIVLIVKLTEEWCFNVFVLDRVFVFSSLWLQLI